MSVPKACPCMVTTFPHTPPPRYIRPHRFKNALLLLFTDLFYLLDALKLDMKSFKSTMKDFKLPKAKLDELIATEIIDKA